MNEYASLYKLQLTKIASFTSPTGIIEPGQRVRIPPFLLTNNGGMPTPDTHLVISVNGDSYILVDEGKCTYEITEKVLAGRSLEITKPLFFRVAEGLNPSFLAETLVSRTNLNLGAAFPRTNVVFKEFLHVPVPINITRPLELSLATGAGIIISDQAAPVSITVANRTRVGFGSSAAQPRLVRLIIELVNCEGHSYVTASACAGSRLPDTIFSLNAPVVYEIDYIPPESEVTISGVVRLDPDQVQLYQHLLFRFSLSVGDVNHPMQQSGLEVIQEKSHSMQVTEYCPASPAATDCMLVVTNTTTAEEIDYWRACFAALGFTMCVWNVALYNGLTYASPLLNFHVSFSGKLVVILNAPFYREDQPPATRQPCYPLTYLESTEVFEAARRYGVRTYIVNYTTPAQPTSEHHHNFSQMLLPMADLKAHSARIADSAFEGRTELYEHMLTVPGSRDELLPAQHTQCKVKLYRAIMTPTESDYNDRMAQLGINIKVCRPDRQYFLCKAFATAVRGEGPNQHGIFRRFDCGHVELRRGLDTTNALVASTAVQAANPVNRPQATTVYVLLKLLPILTKLQMFSTNYTQDSLYREVVAALLSDLADEQHLFITAAEKLPMIGYKKEKELMPSMMVTLITLKGFDFSVLCREEAGRKSLSDFLLRLAFTASQYKQGGIAGQVAKSVQTTCAAVMKSYLGVQGEGEFDGLVRSFGSTQQIGGGYANMIALLRDPRGLSRDVLFNHTVKFSTEVVVGTQTLKSPPTATLLRAALPDMRCETEFTAALAMLSQSPRYHTTDRPAFYPQDPSERVPVDSAHRTVAYSVRGVEPETRVEA